MFDIDQYTRTLAPWQFRVRFNGNAYDTTRPVVGFLLSGMSAEKMTPDEVLAMVSQIAPAIPRSELAKIPLQAAIAMIGAYFDHFADSLKNSPGRPENSPAAQHSAAASDGRTLSI